MNFKRISLAVFCCITFVFIIIAPLYQTITLEDSEDCMRVYTKICQSSGVCEGLLFDYGHIEHINNVGYYSKENLSGHSYGCIMIDKNPLSAIQNTVYCTMIYFYY